MTQKESCIFVVRHSNHIKIFVCVSCLGAVERGVQGVQLHTLEILRVCKSPFCTPCLNRNLSKKNVGLAGSQFQGTPSKLCPSQPERRQLLKRTPLIATVVASEPAECYRSFRAPRALERTSGAGDSSHTGRLRAWKAASDSEVARAPQKLEHAQNT